MKRKFEHTGEELTRFKHEIERERERESEREAVIE
jgi:hypothetical protein